MQYTIYDFNSATSIRINGALIPETLSNAFNIIAREKLITQGEADYLATLPSLQDLASTGALRAITYTIGPGSKAIAFKISNLIKEDLLKDFYLGFPEESPTPGHWTHTQDDNYVHLIFIFN